MLVINCPSCQHPMQASEDRRGQTGTCRKCGEPVTVPLAQMSLDMPGDIGMMDINPDSYTKGIGGVTIPSPTDRRQAQSQFNPFRALGLALMIIGIGCFSYFQFVYDVGVDFEVPKITLFGNTYGGGTGRVANLDKMNQRQNGVISGIGMALLGGIFWGVAELRARQ